MFFKSIRWRLQLWYGVILVAVLVGFGFTAYQLESARRFRSIDEALQTHMAALSRMLQLNSPGEAEPGGRFRDRPPPEEFGNDGPPEFREGRGFRVTPQVTDLFAGGGSNGFYYYIWRRDGGLMSKSANAPPGRTYGGISDPSISKNVPTKTVNRNLTNNSRLALAVNRELATNSFRELPLITPPGECLIVGCSIVPELAELHHFAWSLAGFGGVVLLCGLAGGWWLASRAIRPIEDISATAVKIAGGELSQRIDVADTDNELGRLAGVLNSTFARLEASFAQQAQFTADAAHELRTPVTVILAQTQTALKHERNAADYRATVEACQRAAQRMRRLLELLLELARLDAGQEPMKKMRFDLSNMVGDCVELVRPLAQEQNIKIESKLPALEWVGDMERLAQVITNLLTNAIHYNKEGGEVRVTVQQQNGHAVVTVADTGQGISAEDLPRVFERFYRADKSRSHAAGRTGLGLAISKAIVEAHSGSLEVASQIGTGTTFVLQLPMSS